MPAAWPLRRSLGLGAASLPGQGQARRAPVRALVPAESQDSWGRPGMALGVAPAGDKGVTQALGVPRMLMAAVQPPAPS